ncbi:Proteasome subunit alpha type-3 [Araneus ventricosus]|uniref:Proteasome subunit alpha type n=1 Tax=Araneus ventricosus TaxID=182803 RepID=A0A4Y2DPK0_ARAVE|nr:Proteasome subunit alpha type-3 [Araneus ventricosus]
MSGDSTGYDQLASQFSPEGRLFQVEYAEKALLRSGTVIGLRGRDCVVLAAEKIAPTKLYESSATDRIFSAAPHIGMALVGYLPDARHLLQTARSEAAAYKMLYKEDIPAKDLKLRTAMYVHSYTLYGALRPFGAGLMMASSLSGPELFCIDPFGVAHSYFGCAMGKNQEAAKNEIEQLDLKSMKAEELVKEAAKILYMVHDEKDKNFELEISWTGSITRRKHLKVPARLLQNAEKYAKDAAEERNSD